MAIVDDLREIANRTRRELRAVRDFYEHSALVWESFAKFVGQGHQLSHTSPVTSTEVDESSLVARASDYQRTYLAAFSFRQYVSVFEAFFFDFLARVLQHNPWQFARNQFAFEIVLPAADRDEVIAGVIRKQLGELRYDNVKAWFAALNGVVALDCPSADDVEAIAEVKAARDLLEHNDGVVNALYVRKAGTNAR